MTQFTPYQGKAVPDHVRVEIPGRGVVVVWARLREATHQEKREDCEDYRVDCLGYGHPGSVLFSQLSPHHREILLTTLPDPPLPRLSLPREFSVIRVPNHLYAVVDEAGDRVVGRIEFAADFSYLGKTVPANRYVRGPLQHIVDTMIVLAQPPREIHFVPNPDGESWQPVLPGGGPDVDALHLLAEIGHPAHTFGDYTRWYLPRHTPNRLLSEAVGKNIRIVFHPGPRP